MRSKKLFWTIFVVSLVLGLWAYFALPVSRMPVHLNFYGEVDRYGSKFSGTLLFPLMILGIGLLMLYLDRIDPMRGNVAKSKKALYPLLNGIAAFMLFMQIVFIWLVRTGASKVDSHLILIGVGLLFIFIGNYLPTIKRNFFVGIRTPWTLASDEVWRDTHRIGGWGFVLLGLWTIIVGFLRLDIWWWLAPFILVIVYIGIIYPFYRFKKIQASTASNDDE